MHMAAIRGQLLLFSRCGYYSMVVTIRDAASIRINTVFKFFKFRGSLEGYLETKLHEV